MCDCVRIDRWRNPIRHQRLETPKALPALEAGRVGYKAGHKSLMVAFEKNRPMGAIARHQLVDHLSRRGSTIDIITKKDLNTLRNRIFCQIRVNAFEHLLKKIRATVDVADRINADPSGTRGRCFFREGEDWKAIILLACYNLLAHCCKLEKSQK